MQFRIYKISSMIEVIRFMVIFQLLKWDTKSLLDKEKNDPLAQHNKKKSTKHFFDGERLFFQVGIYLLVFFFFFSSSRDEGFFPLQYFYEYLSSILYK